MIQTDIQLIHQIKQNQDSGAVLELVNRHSGVYYNTIQKYAAFSSFNQRANIGDLKEDRTVNIYQWALSYDENRGMKFGSYVGQMAKYMCLGIIERQDISKTYNEDLNILSDIDVAKQAENDLAVEDIEHEVADMENSDFRQIFTLRHGRENLSWRAIGNKMNMSHEGVRKIYNKHIGSIKEHALT